MIVLSNIIFMLVYVVTSVSGLVLLKMSDGKLLSYSGVAGIFLYGAGFIIWYLILTRVSLSIAFPIAAGGLVVATQVAGYFILKGIKISDNDFEKSEMAVNMAQSYFELRNRKKFNEWANLTRKYGEKGSQYVQYIEHFEQKWDEK